jgi:hypothetical protein
MRRNQQWRAVLADHLHVSGSVDDAQYRKHLAAVGNDLLHLGRTSARHVSQAAASDERRQGAGDGVGDLVALPNGHHLIESEKDVRWMYEKQILIIASMSTHKHMWISM